MRAHPSLVVRSIVLAIMMPCPNPSSLRLSSDHRLPADTFHGADVRKATSRVTALNRCIWRGVRHANLRVLLRWLCQAFEPRHQQFHGLGPHQPEANAGSCYFSVRGCVTCCRGSWPYPATKGGSCPLIRGDRAVCYCALRDVWFSAANNALSGALPASISSFLAS